MAVETDMNFQDRLANICAGMQDERLALLVALHDGAHFIEKPNPVMVLSGFKAIGAAATMLQPDGARVLIVTPASDAERAAELSPRARVVGTDDVLEALLPLIGEHSTQSTNNEIGLAGLSFLPSGMA